MTTESFVGSGFIWVHPGPQNRNNKTGKKVDFLIKELQCTFNDYYPGTGFVPLRN